LFARFSSDRSSTSLGLGLLIVAVLATALGLSRLLQNHIEHHMVVKVLDSQKQKIRARVAAFDATLRRSESSVLRYSHLISYRSADLALENPSLEPIAHRDPDGSWRTPRNRFNPLTDANIWLPPSVPLTEENRRFFKRSYSITRIFGLGAQNDVVENAWMLPLIGGMTAFWPSKPNYLYNADSQLDYRSTPWVTSTDPRQNPGHAVRWVGPEYDPAARDWSISVVAPFFHDGQWAGSVGHDMRVSRLLGLLIEPNASAQDSFSRPLYVTTSDGSVLAKREGAPARGERVPAPLLHKMQQALTSNKLAVVANRSNYLVLAPITTLHAWAVYVVDGGWIRQTLRDELSLLHSAEGLFVVVSVGAVVGLAAKDAQARRQRQSLLEQRNQDLERLSRIDQLTLLPNRLGLQERCEEAL
jgi:hypothetical protein